MLASYARWSICVCVCVFVSLFFAVRYANKFNPFSFSNFSVSLHNVGFILHTLAWRSHGQNIQHKDIPISALSVLLLFIIIILRWQQAANILVIHGQISRVRVMNSTQHNTTISRHNIIMGTEGMRTVGVVLMFDALGIYSLFFRVFFCCCC